MTKLRLFLALVMWVSALTPSMASVCATSCDMSAMPMAAAVKCHGMDQPQTPAQKKTSQDDPACPWAAVCSVAGMAFLNATPAAAPQFVAVMYLHTTDVIFSSYIFPPPLEPPIV